jgi:hypothetical protein
MALALQITFKDPEREDVYHPFSFEDVLRRCWWPIAQRFGLPHLQQLECLTIRERQEAENLLGELEVVRNALESSDHEGISPDEAAYMLKRIEEVDPLIREALEDWGKVSSLSL